MDANARERDRAEGDLLTQRFYVEARCRHQSTERRLLCLDCKNGGGTIHANVETGIHWR